MKMHIRRVISYLLALLPCFKYSTCLYCLRVQERMQDPVVAADGFTYERAHIQQWVQRSQLSPAVTGQPLPRAALTPNNTLAALLQSGI